MKAKAHQERCCRRSFLKGAVLAGGAVLALGPGKALGSNRQGMKNTGSLSKRYARYRETEHVRTYYHLARL